MFGCFLCKLLSGSIWSIGVTHKLKEAALQDVWLEQMLSRWGTEGAGLRCSLAARSHVVQREACTSHGTNKSPSIHCYSSSFHLPASAHCRNDYSAWTWWWGHYLHMHTQTNSPSKAHWRLHGRSFSVSTAECFLTLRLKCEASRSRHPDAVCVLAVTEKTMKCFKCSLISAIHHLLNT